MDRLSHEKVAGLGGGQSARSEFWFRDKATWCQKCRVEFQTLLLLLKNNYFLQ